MTISKSSSNLLCSLAKEELCYGNQDSLAFVFGTVPRKGEKVGEMQKRRQERKTPLPVGEKMLPEKCAAYTETPAAAQIRLKREEDTYRITSALPFASYG